jgi:hypothetical protein
MLEMGLKCGAKDPELRGVAVAAFFFSVARFTVQPIRTSRSEGWVAAFVPVHPSQYKARGASSFDGGDNDYLIHCSIVFN